MEEKLFKAIRKTYGYTKEANELVSWLIENIKHGNIN